MVFLQVMWATLKLRGGGAGSVCTKRQGWWGQGREQSCADVGLRCNFSGYCSCWPWRLPSLWEISSNCRNTGLPLLCTSPLMTKTSVNIILQASCAEGDGCSTENSLYCVTLKKPNYSPPAPPPKPPPNTLQQMHHTYGHWEVDLKSVIFITCIIVF